MLLIEILISLWTIHRNFFCIFKRFLRHRQLEQCQKKATKRNFHCNDCNLSFVKIEHYNLWLKYITINYKPKPTMIETYSIASISPHIKIFNRFSILFWLIAGFCCVFYALGLLFFLLCTKVKSILIRLLMNEQHCSIMLTSKQSVIAVKDFCLCFEGFTRSTVYKKYRQDLDSIVIN